MTFTIVSSDELRHLIQAHVAHDPVSINHLGNYPYLHIAAIPGEWRNANWQIRHLENVKEPLNGCIMNAVKTLQEQYRLATPFLGNSATLG